MSTKGNGFNASFTLFDNSNLIFSPVQSSCLGGVTAISRLCCMAAMAPALTDASAHPSSFKLPVSPADPGQTGFEATPSDPTSPGLPNGHSNTNHTHIDSDQSIQNSEFGKDLLLKQGVDNQVREQQSQVKGQAF